MADENETTPGGTPVADASAVADAGAAGSKQDSTLASRLNGQVAKVNELTGKVSAAEAARDAAIAKLSDYEAGKVGADEALKSQLAAKEAELAAERQERALERARDKYPESFAELGAAAAALTTEQLAALEARLSGATEEVVPTPRKHNESKTGPGGKPAVKPPTFEDAKAAFLAGPVPEWARRS